MKDLRHILLIVEDDPNDRLLVRLALQEIEAGYAVYELANGQEAINYLEGKGEYMDRHRFPFPSTIITDLKMPRADGFAVLEHIKNHPEWSVIPIVVLSASPDPNDIERAYCLGANSYLRKPSGYEELRELLSRFYRYWASCEIPQVDDHGVRFPTASSGKLGDRFDHSEG